MSKTKKLFAIYTDYTGKVLRTKIAQGTTADFVHVIGFQIEDFQEEENYPDTNVSSSESLGLNGTYPVIHASEFSNLEGKLLTLCDATFTNKEQREAFKSVVKEILWTKFSDNVSATEGNYLLAVNAVLLNKK